MKKAVCFLVCLAIGFAVFAEEDSREKIRDPRFSVGAGYTYMSNPRLHGGHFDFGIRLFSNFVYVQNNIQVRAGGFKLNGENSSLFTLSDKLIFGRQSGGTYLYIEGGVGVFGNDNKDLFEDPFAYNFGFGGGFDMSTGNNKKYGGLYFEAGYLAQKITKKFPSSGVAIQTGWRLSF